MKRPPVEPPKIYIPDPPQWYSRMLQSAGLPVDPAFQVKILKPIGKTGKSEVHWQSNIGPQTWASFCNFEEVLLGGKRGGGKTVVLIAKPAMGDLTLPENDPARVSFLNDPSYRALFLREEYQSMLEFVEQAIEFYRPFGGKPSGNPVRIDFKTGARIYFNHLGDEEAFSKYKGWNLTFIGIEELTQIRTLKQYLKLLGSLRSVERMRTVPIEYEGKRYNRKMPFPALRTQMAATTNPDGPGASWILERFVEVPVTEEIREKTGLIHIPWNHPMRDTYTGSTRIFIPFGVEANPYLSEDTPAGKRYRSNLMAQDEVTRKQWMEGDWHADSSMFFSEYRPNGPIGDEEKEKYPWARHIIKSTDLKPWWYRWGSGDWGYDHPAAFHKAVRNESDGRVHIYDEMQVRRVGSFEMGALLAKWWHPDLLALKAAGQDPTVTIHMGADVFSKDDSSKTKAQQMEAGIKEVLGPYGALLLKYDETEQEAALRNPKYAAQLFERRRKELQGRMCIMLKPIYIDRVTGWSYMREMLRFRSAILELQTPEAREQYLKDVLESEGREAYERHAADLRTLKPEVLPKMILWQKCAELDRCMKAAQRDMRNENDPSKISKSEDVLKQNAIDGESGDDALECLIAGTLVRDERGLLPIELIRNGDLVWTRAGLRPVMACGKIKKNAAVFTVKFSDGSRLTGTENHMVFAEGKGFVSLTLLRNGDKVKSWQSQRQSCSMVPSFTDTQTLQEGRPDVISPARWGFFIERYGRTVLALFRRAAKYTTRTGIASITQSRTSSVSRSESINWSTLRRSAGTDYGRSSQQDNAQPPHGDVPGDGLSPLPRNAQGAALNIPSPSPTQQSLSSAPRDAVRHGLPGTESPARRVFAKFAGLLSCLKIHAASSARSVVVIRAAEADGMADVYDLSVGEYPEYYANGILVHNSARNLIAAFKEIETTMPKSYFVSERMGEAQKDYVANFGEELTDPTRLRQIAQTQASIYDKQNPATGRQFTFPRAGSQRHRGVN